MLAKLESEQFISQELGQLAREFEIEALRTEVVEMIGSAAPVLADD